MVRFEVIESKSWRRDDGRTASIYGAVPWVTPSEEKRWKMVTRGYTARDNERGTVGIGRQPWATRAEAQAWVEKETSRLEEARRLREASFPKKSPAQLQREIDEALGKKRRAPKTRAHATMKPAPSDAWTWHHGPKTGPDPIVAVDSSAGRSVYSYSHDLDRNDRVRTYFEHVQGPILDEDTLDELARQIDIYAYSTSMAKRYRKQS